MKTAQGEQNRGFYRFALGLCTWVMRLFYRLEVHGIENLPKTGRVILCMNHISNLDPIFVGMAIGKIRHIYYMAKAELFRIPLLNKAFRALGAFPVERGTGGADALQHARFLLEQEHLLGIFIEGTRSKTGELLQPKTGAALIAYQTQSTVLPMSIATKNGKTPRLFGRVILRFGDPVPFSQLGFVQGSGMEMRKCSRAMMERIRLLRAQDMSVFQTEKSGGKAEQER